MCIERCKHGSNGESLCHHALGQWHGGLSNYDSVNLSQVILTAKPVEKIKQSGEGKGNKYFIAEFSYKVLNAEKQEEVKQLGEALNIWRTETLTGDAEVEISVNYKPPIQHLNGDGTAEEIKELPTKETEIPTNKAA